MERLLDEEKNAFNLSKGLISVDLNKYKKDKEEQMKKYERIKRLREQNVIKQDKKWHFLIDRNDKNGVF